MISTRTRLRQTIDYLSLYILVAYGIASIFWRQGGAGRFGGGGVFDIVSIIFFRVGVR